MNAPLRVLIVDDPSIGGKAVYEALTGLPDVEIAGVAASLQTALEKFHRHHPDLVLLNLSVPRIQGHQLLCELKEADPSVGVIVLNDSTDEGARGTMLAFAAGAFDYIAVSRVSVLPDDVSWLREELRGKLNAFMRAGGAPRKSFRPRYRPAVVAVGISTGGPQSLAEMLPRLPADLPVPMLVVQHMPPVFTRKMANNLNRRCALHVCEAADGQPVVPGAVLIAPGGTQMKVDRDGPTAVVRITDDPPEHSCKPSVDYLFRSVAEVYGGNALGVLMTGMGSDGVHGCRLLKERGAVIMAQDEESCVVYGMPGELVAQGLADIIAPLDQIAARIVRLTRS